jgi:Holliday junction resolvasome RuvABC endonuclease subunit
VRALLKLAVCSPSYDASDALAVALCHVHTSRFNRRVVGEG